MDQRPERLADAVVPHAARRRDDRCPRERTAGVHAREDVAAESAPADAATGRARRDGARPPRDGDRDVAAAPALLRPRLPRAGRRAAPPRAPRRRARRHGGRDVPSRGWRTAGTSDPARGRGRGGRPRDLRRSARRRLAEGDRFLILLAVIARARTHAGAIWLLAATMVANVLGYGYQVVMARLLRPEDYAILIALFGILILESISSQVIQSATAKLTAQYKARDDEAALHLFVRRWSVRIVVAVAAIASAIAVLSGPISAGLSLPILTVVLLGVSLFFAALLTFALGLLQGLARFGWMGSVLIVQAAARLAMGVALVAVFGGGVFGAFTGATAAVGVALLVAIVPLVPLLR